jgi:hypothetical protein
MGRYSFSGSLDEGALFGLGQDLIERKRSFLLTGNRAYFNPHPDPPVASAAVRAPMTMPMASPLVLFRSNSGALRGLQGCTTCPGLEGKARRKLKKGFKKLGTVVKKGSKSVLKLAVGVAVTAGPAICQALEDPQQRAGCMAAVATVQGLAARGQPLPEEIEFEIPEDSLFGAGIKTETLMVVGGLTAAGLITALVLL